MAKTWFITGASSGFGRKCAELALAAGDKVATAARRAYLLDDLKTIYGANLLLLKLDVTDVEAVKTAVNSVTKTFGQIDVLVNNAGIGYYAPVEELSCDKAGAVMETNYWGSLNVIQAVLPGMRTRRAGHIIQITSLSGIITFPLMGAYSPSKWALEGLLETLSMEVGDFSIKVTMVEPGPFVTDFHANVQYEQHPLAAYDLPMQAHQTQMKEARFEDAEIVARGIMRLAAMEAPPLRAVAGTGMFDLIKQSYEQRLQTWAILEEL